MVSLATPMNFARSWRAQGAGRTLISNFGKIGLSRRQSRAMARLTKIALAPGDYLARRTSLTTGTLQVPHGKDYAIFAAAQITGLDKLRAHCEAMFEKRKAKVLAATSAPYSLFSFEKTEHGPRATTPDDMAPIVDFLCQPGLVAMAANYIGEVPVLGNICLWWSIINSERAGPQNVHRDMNSKRQLHLVIPIRPVDAGTGPFTFLPGDRSREVAAQIGHDHGRLEDDKFYKHVNRDEMIPFTSDKGAMLVINPYACFHFGGRATTNPRFVLICSYTSRFESAEEGTGVYRLTNREHFTDGSRLRRRLLSL